MSEAIQLINCDLEVLDLIARGDEALGRKLKVVVPSPWTEFKDVFPYVVQQIRPNPDHAIWWTYLPIDKEKRILLGTCGFKGPPDQNGMVEIGYEVASDFRNQGYATQIAHALIELAKKDHRVKVVQAHTMPERNASTRVLEKNGFQFVEAIKHFEDGLVWKWVLPVTLSNEK